MEDIRTIFRNISGRSDPPICTATLTVNDQLMVCSKHAGHEKTERTEGKVTFRSYHYSPDLDMYWYADDSGDIAIHSGF